jgi:hypothetical protein
LKAVEEPSMRTVFLLCTPSTHPDDVSVTIRSRCRVVTLRTPAADAIAEMLQSDGTDAHTAAWAAAAAQGHIGRARRLARDPEARTRREAVLAVPRRLTGIGACFDAAAALISATDAEATANLSDGTPRNARSWRSRLGAGGTGKGAAAPPAIRGCPEGAGEAAEGPEHEGQARRASTARWWISPAFTGTSSCAESARRSPRFMGTRLRRRVPRRNGRPRARCAGSRRCSSVEPRSTSTSSHRSPSRR